MERPKCIFIAALILPLAFPAMSQTSEPAGGQAPQTSESAPEWSAGSINFSGLVDGYYSFNLNHPESRNNQLRNFDVLANQFTLNMAKLTMDHEAAPVGFRIDLGFGRAFDMVHAAESSPGIFRNIEQAYVSVKPARARGLQLDFGKFVTSAGAEVIETQNNWNYSRSLLFALAIPYYHFGVRTSMPLGSHFSAGAQLVNGWNNVEDNNTGKTVGLTGAITTSQLTWSHNYYVGPEKANTNTGLRHIYDTTLSLTPHRAASLYVNFDYGVDKNPAAGNSRWTGVAGAARVALNSWFALAPRVEWFNDADGFSTGTVQKLKEFTLTAEMKARQGVLARLEYRQDWSDTDYFDRGSTPASYRTMPTLTAGFVAFFGPKR